MSTNFRDIILTIGDTMFSWLAACSIGDLVVAWLTTSLVAYLLTRRAYRIRKWAWDHGDAILMSVVSVVYGPIWMFVATVCNLRSKSISTWLNNPSRW